MLVMCLQYRFEVLPRIACSTEALSSFITGAFQFEVRNLFCRQILLLLFVVSDSSYSSVHFLFIFCTILCIAQTMLSQDLLLSK